MPTEMTVVEEAIVDSSRKIQGLQDAIKNLKTQYKEVFEKYEGNSSKDTAKTIADILVSMKDSREEIKSLKKDIAVNIIELSKPKENK